MQFGTHVLRIVLLLGFDLVVHQLFKRELLILLALLLLLLSQVDCLDLLHNTANVALVNVVQISQLLRQVSLQIDVEYRLKVGLHQMSRFLLRYQSLTLLQQRPTLHIKILKSKQIVGTTRASLQNRINSFLNLNHKFTTNFS